MSHSQTDRGFIPYFLYRDHVVVILLCLTSNQIFPPHTDHCVWDEVLFLASSAPVSQLDIRLTEAGREWGYSRGHLQPEHELKTECFIHQHFLIETQTAL